MDWGGWGLISSRHDTPQILVARSSGLYRRHTKSDTPLPSVSPYVLVLKLLGRNADGLTFNCNPRYCIGPDSPLLLNILFQYIFIQQDP